MSKAKRVQVTFFNWRIIALQYWFHFCHTSTWISHRYTLCSLPLKHLSHLPPHPIPLGCYRALVWIPWVIQQISIGYRFYTWKCTRRFLKMKVFGESQHAAWIWPEGLQGCLLTCKHKAKSFKGPPRDCKSSNPLWVFEGKVFPLD